MAIQVGDVTEVGHIRRRRARRVVRRGRGRWSRALPGAASVSSDSGFHVGRRHRDLVVTQPFRDGAADPFAAPITRATDGLGSSLK